MSSSSSDGATQAVAWAWTNAETPAETFLLPFGQVMTPEYS